MDKNIVNINFNYVEIRFNKIFVNVLKSTLYANANALVGI